MLKLFLSASLLCLVTAHYSIHDWNAMGPYIKVSGANESCDEPLPELYSYHIHVIFWGSNPEHTASAMALRQRFIERFDLHNKNCTITPGDPAPGHEMCVFDPHTTPYGPFLNGEFAFFIPPVLLQETSAWMLQHKGIHDVFIHPNSGCETNDHTLWNTYSGVKWPIDYTIFSCDYPGCVPKH